MISFRRAVTSLVRRLESDSNFATTMANPIMSAIFVETAAAARGMVKETVSIILGLAQDPSFHPTNLCVHEEKQEETLSIVLSAVINLE